MNDVDNLRRVVALCATAFYVGSRLIRNYTQLEHKSPELNGVMSGLESLAGSLALGAGIREILPAGYHPQFVPAGVSAAAGIAINGVRENILYGRANFGKMGLNILGAAASVI